MKCNDCDMSADPLAAYSLGFKLRTLRTRKNLTLSRLAAQTGFSTALLSKLETDRMHPTLATLEKICRTYGIGLGYFFCEPLHHSVAITRGAHISANRERPTARRIPLHVPTADSQLLSQVIEIVAGGSFTATEYGSTTEVTAYVISGTLEVTLGNSQEVLQPGDSIVITTDQPIVWTAPTSSPCRMLAVFARASLAMKQPE